MRNRLTIISLSICLVFCSFSFAFAEGNTNLDKKYMSDYTVETQVGSDVFNPGEFTVDLALNAVDWLGVSDKSTSVTFKTGATAVYLSKKLPNLAQFVMAEEIAKASMTGNTFLCSNTPDVSWDGQTGKWTTVIDAPVENIRYALDSFREYLTITDARIRESYQPALFPSFYDNMILIKKGTSIQYGNTVITFNKDCEIDELYDEYCQKDFYESTFAENVFRIKEATDTTAAADNAIVFNIAKNSYMQFCEKKFLAKDNIAISINGADTQNADPLSAVSAALDTAKRTNETYVDSKGREGSYHEQYADMGDVHPTKEKYYIHKCNADKVFNSGFGLINELLGVLAQKDAKIVVVSDGGEAVESAGRVPDPEAAVAAELKISSTEAVPCEHVNTEIRDAREATVTEEGSTGNIYCTDCGRLVEEGEKIDKLPSSIKLKYTSLTLKVGQSTSVEKVTFVKGDSIKSITSSNNNIVKAAKSGTNVVKLTAGKKVGTAKVTVKLAGGKSAVVTVKVQKTDVACTGLTVSSGTSVKLKKGKTHQIKVTRKPVTCVQKITYKTSNKSVATVTSKGKVKAVKKGTAKITIKCGKKSKVVKIVVK